MNQNEWVVRFISFRASLKSLFEKKEQVITPVWKAVFTFACLMLLRALFPYGGVLNKIWLIALISVAQAFIPMSFLYFTASALILADFWKLSVDISVGFAILCMACLLFSVKFNYKYIYVAILTMVMFFLHLEYLIPVSVGLLIGFYGLIPVGAGVLFYYYGKAVNEFSETYTGLSGDAGSGIESVIQKMISDKAVIVILLAFILVIIVTTIFRHLFYERAWLISVIGGNVFLALALLAGRLVLSLDFAIWRIFILALISAIVGTMIEFFRGVGDVSRIEKVYFEDEEYIYYVKAVPKIKVSQREKNVTSIERDEKEPVEFADEKENEDK